MVVQFNRTYHFFIALSSELAMDAAHLVLQLMLTLLSARVLAEAAMRLHAPALIGGLLAGTVLCPSLLSSLRPDAAIRTLLPPFAMKAMYRRASPA